VSDPAPVLEARDVSAFYGPIQALDGVSAVVGEKEVVALIGPNGAGKTTLLNVLSGALLPARGSVAHRGRDVTRLAAHRRVPLGISHVPERRQLFGPLSVMDNLLLGGYVRARREGRRALDAQFEVVFGLFPILADRRNQRAATLSGGEQQMLALGRGLMARPELMLLDEPSLGLAPQLARTIFTTISRLPELGTAVLLVEQNARMALHVADRGYVMETGRVVVGGSAEQLRANPRVQEAYLGKLRMRKAAQGTAGTDGTGNGAAHPSEEDAAWQEHHEPRT
jgi:branched-chain amino acid transport system ATP-binding protein